MSSAGATDFPGSVSTNPKNKRNKKKKNAKARTNGDSAKPNGVKNDEEKVDHDADEEEQDTSDLCQPQSPTQADTDDRLEAASGMGGGFESSMKNYPDQRFMESNGEQGEASLPKPITQPAGPDRTKASSAQDGTRLEDMAREREALRDEVSYMRKSLEKIQERHEEEMGRIREQLSQTEEGREQAQTQYQNLLGKVNTIRSQLGERLKADAEDLKEARSKIEDLEEQNETLRKQGEARAAELATAVEDNEQRSKELSTLRNRMTLSQQNWTKEREDLIQREKFAKEEFEAAKQAMSDWEILAIEERSIRENIAEKVADLEDQVASQREGYERAASERDSQSTTVDALQRALQEIQDARRKELREIVENSQAQVNSLQTQLREAESKATEASNILGLKKEELERALPFEKEVKEKNLLIGKLRHEAVILNDHLTKALRYLKKGKPQDTIDKQLITNHFMHFLALDRTDAKKFQVLQIIASLLEWSDEQREQAGLARPGASNPSSKIPVSPWHRTPSTPQLSTDFFPNVGTRTESLAELWSGFLEQEAQEKPSGVRSPPSSSGGSKPP